jgi:alanine racemase
MLAVLNGLTPGTEAEYVTRDLTPVLGSLREIACWRQAARRSGQVLTALLHIDTGMSRLGLDAGECAALQKNPALLDGIALRYVMTHLACSEQPRDPKNEAQRKAFADACARLPPASRSLANSSGIFLGTRFGSDLARAGAALYGVNPTPSLNNPMRPVVRLRARILHVRDLPAGATVGYNATWTAARPSHIATASIGYADGWMRSLAGRGAASFDGRAVPLVGRVSMDLTTFDVTGCPGAIPGAWLDLIGPGQTVDAVAEAAGTNGYEVLTSLGQRFGRIYLAS